MLVVIGSGFMARAIAKKAGQHLGAIVSLSAQRVGEIGKICGKSITTCKTPTDVFSTTAKGEIAHFMDLTILSELPQSTVVIDASGKVPLGLEVAEIAVSTRKRFVSFNAETDVLFGPYLADQAQNTDSVYCTGDGDQHSVLHTLISDCFDYGIAPVAAVNCKGFLDISATPASIAQWCDKNGGTSSRMTTAFTDGTKINIEQAILSNLSGFLPIQPGMTGVRTTLTKAIEDFIPLLERKERIVEYTLGGDFAGGVFVIGKTTDDFDRRYLSYMKMGNGPYYLFYRPYHLCHFEVLRNTREGTYVRRPLSGSVPCATVATVAKRDLTAGQTLDGIGGYDIRGSIYAWKEGRHFLPVSLSEGAVVTKNLRAGDLVPFDSIELPSGRPSALYQKILEIGDPL